MEVYGDLIEKYENSIEPARDMGEGEVFIVNMLKKPENLCDSVWKTYSNCHDIILWWRKHLWDEKREISNNLMHDDFRPASFHIKAFNEEAK